MRRTRDALRMEVTREVRLTTRFMKVAMVIAIVAIALFGVGLPALAQVDGPTPPELGDPVGTNVSPHGGFSSGTDFCLQCHSVHTAPDPGFALMARSSTTGVCATCHAYGIGGAVTGPIDPGFDPQVEGTASTRAVYTSTAVHIIGADGPSTFTSGWTFGGWTFGGGPSAPGTTRTTTVRGTAAWNDGGLYCASCHTPHGEFGQLINSEWAVTTADQGGGSGSVSAAVVPWANDTRIWWENPVSGSWEQRYLWQASAGAPWQVCTGLGGTGTCAYAQVLDAENQLVSLYGYKLLSSSPNHQYPYRSGATFTETGTSTPPAAKLYSNTGAQIGTLVGGVTATDLTLTVNETAGTLVSRPGASCSPRWSPAYVQIDSEIIAVCSITGSTFPSASATYTVAPADAEGKTGRGWNNTTPALHSAGANVITMGSSRAAVRSWGVDRYNHDAGLFCGTCHSSRIDWSDGGTNHNHPTGCQACHGNPSSGLSSDFPHSSANAFMLIDLPDGLCINCHSAGSLP